MWNQICLSTRSLGPVLFPSTAPTYFHTLCSCPTISLAVNTILQSSHINDIEGGMSTTVALDTLPQASLEDMMGKGIATMPTMFDETAQCTPAFRVLKSLVQTWIHDVVHYHNEHADIQLMHFYRWLKSSHAHLYDPALFRMIRGMMKKVFMQLIAEFRRLVRQLFSFSSLS